MEGNNGITKMRNFFAKGSREVTLQEYTAFWKTLNDAEKTEFRLAAERWDGVSEFIPAAIAAPTPLLLPEAVLASA